MEDCHTPYVGTALKKMAATLHVHKVRFKILPYRCSFYEPFLSFSSVPSITRLLTLSESITEGDT